MKKIIKPIVDFWTRLFTPALEPVKDSKSFTMSYVSRATEIVDRLGGLPIDVETRDSINQLDGYKALVEISELCSDDWTMVTPGYVEPGLRRRACKYMLAVNPITVLLLDAANAEVWLQHRGRISVADELIEANYPAYTAMRLSTMWDHEGR